MKRTAAAVLVLSLLYLLAWPSSVQPVSWDAPIDAGLTGVFEPNDQLSPAGAIELGEHNGPEDVSVGARGELFATSHNGAILKIQPAFARVSVFAEAGGRPLGIETHADGSLIVANAFIGLQRVSPTGEVTTLLSEVNGEPLVYVNDLAIATNGTIYFSESSSKFGALESGGTLEASLLDVMEHNGHGRIFAFDPESGTTRTIVEGLAFANGVAISDDQRYLLITESANYRILRHWLAGPDAGTTEVVLDNLPGFPDNINNGFNGRFWVGLIAPRNTFLDRTADKPFLRKVAQRLPSFLRPRPTSSSHVIAITGDGEVLMNLQDPDAHYPMLTGVLETPRTLYLTTLVGNSLPRLEKQDLL